MREPRRLTFRSCPFSVAMTAFSLSSTAPPSPHSAALVHTRTLGLLPTFDGRREDNQSYVRSYACTSRHRFQSKSCILSRVRGYLPCGAPNVSGIEKYSINMVSGFVTSRPLYAALHAFVYGTLTGMHIRCGKCLSRGAPPRSRATQARPATKNAEKDHRCSANQARRLPCRTVPA